jgi:hypothetical protein
LLKLTDPESGDIFILRTFADNNLALPTIVAFAFRDDFDGGSYFPAACGRTIRIE